VPGYVEDELRGYLECGILCFGFARAVCMTCRTGFVVAARQDGAMDGPPTDWGELVQAHDNRDVFQATDRRAALDRHQ